jgi:hypothetical protein
MATILDHLRTYLIANGVGRDPRVAGAAPPIWRQPAAGTPAPGEPPHSGSSSSVEIGDPAVIGLMRTGGIPQSPQEVEWRRDIVDIWIRSRTWPQTESTWNAIRLLLIGTHAQSRQGWTMSGLAVIESQEWRTLSLLDSDPAQGFTSQAAVLFQTYSDDHV